MKTNDSNFLFKFNDNTSSLHNPATCKYIGFLSDLFS